MKKPQSKQKLSTLALLAATPGVAVAGPQGAATVAGSVTVSQASPQATIIDQHSSKAIINWQSFSIGSNEYVQFRQPDSNSVSLNRVVGRDPSTILGNLSANGQVFLVNPNGIYFGAGASLDVGGLVASTLDIDNDDFLNGNYVFTQPNVSNASSVVNAGVIQARESGYVVLMSKRVENTGSVKTRFGQIALLSGGEVSLDINGDGLVSYSIDSATATGLAGVENAGELVADGGRVILAGKVSRDLVATAVNNSGLIQANGIEERNGEIYLTGNADVYNSGRLEASGEVGGSIFLQGARVAQQGDIHADATQGKGGTVSIQADEVIALTQASLTTANAGTNGNGGEVIAYTTGSAIFNYGARIEAKGGSIEGDGGFVEVSGLDKVEINGQVDASATVGKAGTFLIDPTDISIVSVDDAGVPDLTDPGSGDPRVFENDNSNSNEILDTTIEALLDGGTSVTLETASSGTADGNITVDAQIDKTAGGAATLTLNADNNIILNQDIVSTSGALNVSLEADGSVSFNTGADITSNGGDVTITADKDTSNNGETITMLDGTFVNAGSGKINLTADSNITIGRLITTDTSNTSVQLDSKNGSILDAGDTGGADISSAGRLVISAETGVAGIETDVDSLNVVNDTSGDIVITEATALTVDRAEQSTAGNINISTTNGSITVNDGGGGNDVIVARGTGTIDIETGGTGSDIILNDRLLAENGNITLVAADSVDFQTNGKLTSNTDVSITATAGAIVDNNGSSEDVAAAKLSLVAATGVGASGNAIETNVMSLDLRSVTGGLYIRENDDVTVLTASTMTSGNISIAADGGITVSDGDDMTATTVIQAAGSGAITLDATSANNDDIDIRDAIQSDTGAINLMANDSISFSDDGDVTSNSGILTVTADANNNGNGDNNDAITLSSGSVFNTGSGAIDLNSEGTIALGQLTTTGTVNIDVSNGAITDANDMTGNIVGSTVTLTTRDGIGSVSNALETAATALDLSVSNTGDIIIDQSGNVDLAGIDTADGNIAITASGAVTTSAAVAATDGDVTLTTTGSSNVTISNTVSAMSSGNANRSVDILATGDVVVNAAVTSSVGGNGDASISIGSLGSEAASLMIGATGSLNVTEGGTGDTETLAVFVSGSIDTTNTSLSANDGISLSGGSVSTAGLMASSGTVSVTADNGNILLTTVDADAISLTNTGMTNGDITTGQLDADNGGITVNAAGAFSTTGNTVTATGAVDLDGASVTSGNITSSGSTVDVTGTTGSISVATIDSDGDVTLNAKTSLSTGDVTVSNDAISLIAGTTLTLAELVTADTLSLSAGGVVSISSVNPLTASSSITLAGTGAGTSFNVTTDTAQLNLNGGLNSVIVDNSAFDGVSAGIAFNNSGFGTVTLDTDVATTVTGNLSASGTVDIDSANASLMATGSLSGNTGVVLNGSAVSTAGLTASGGSVSVTANDGDISLGAVSADSISITNTGMNNGDITTAQLDADNGGISVTGTGDVQTGNANALLSTGATVGLSGNTVTAGNIATNAATGVVNITANASSGGTLINAGNITAATVLLDGQSISAGSITANSLTVQDGVGVAATDLTLTGVLTTPTASITVSDNLVLNNVASINGISLSANIVSTGTLTTTNGAANVTADTGDITLGAVSADSISITNTGMSNGDITTGQLDADNGGISVTGTGDVQTGNANALLSTGATVGLSGNTVTAGNIATNAATGVVNITANATSGSGTISIGNVTADAVSLDGFSISANALTGNSLVVQDGMGLANDLILLGNLNLAMGIDISVDNELNVKDVTASTGNISLVSTASTIDSGNVSSTLGSVNVNANGQYNLVGDINAATGITVAGNGISGSSNGDLTTTAGNIGVTAATGDISIADITANAMGASISVEATTGDVAVGALNADTVNIIASNLTLNDTYTTGNFTATNTLRVNGTISNNAILLTAKDFLLSNTGILQDPGTGSSITINASDSIVLDGTVNVAAGTFNASITGISGSITGSGTNTAGTINLQAQGDIGASAANQLSLNATTINVSGTLTNAFVDLRASNSTFNVNSAISNNLDVDAVNLNLSGSATVSATDMTITTTGTLTLGQSLNALNTLGFDVGSTADDGGNTVTTPMLSLVGSGSYGSAMSPFNSTTTMLDINSSVNAVVIDNAATTTTTVNLSGAGTHGSLDISGLSDINLTAGAAIVSNALSLDTTGALDIARAMTVSSPNSLSLQANGINSNSNTLTADTINLTGVANSNLDVVTNSAVVNLGSGLDTVTLDSSANALTSVNFTATNYGDVAVNSAGLTINGGTVNTGNIAINAGTGNITNNANINATAAMGSTTVTLDTAGQLMNNGLIAATDMASSSSITVGGITPVTAISGIGEYRSDSITFTATDTATLSGVTNTGVFVVNGGSAVSMDNTAFTGVTNFTYGKTNYTSLDLNFGGATTLTGGAITTSGTSTINGQSDLTLNQSYTAAMINLAAGGQVTVDGILTAPTINLAGNGTANFASSTAKLMTNASTVDLATGIGDIFLDNTANAGSSTVNISGTNYGVVDLDFGGTSAQVGTASTSTLQGNDFLANALAVSTNGNLNVSAGFDVSGGTVPGVEGDTLLTSSVAAVGGLINAGGSSDPNASFIATDAVNLNINNLSQSNQYLLVKADDINFTGTSDAANLLVQLTPFSISQTDLLGNTVFASLSLNQTTPGIADFNYTFADHFAPFTGTTIGLGEQGFSGDISIGSLNAGSKNLLFLSGGVITGLDNIVGSGLLGTADEVGGFFVVRPTVTTVTTDQLGIFGFRFGARVSTIELDGSFDAIGERQEDKEDLDLEDDGVNDGEEKQCS